MRLREWAVIKLRLTNPAIVEWVDPAIVEWVEPKHESGETEEQRDGQGGER